MTSPIKYDENWKAELHRASGDAHMVSYHIEGAKFCPTVESAEYHLKQVEDYIGKINEALKRARSFRVRPVEGSPTSQEGVSPSNEQEK